MSKLYCDYHEISHGRSGCPTCNAERAQETMKPTLEALLENFRERGANRYAFIGDSIPPDEIYRRSHGDLAPLFVKAIETLKLCAESGSINSKWAAKTIAEIEAALAQGTEARGEGEKR